jgi:hypothetical protein
VNGHQYDLQDDQCYNSDYDQLYDLFDPQRFDEDPAGLKGLDPNLQDVLKLNKKYKSQIKRAKKRKTFKLNTLNQYDENQVCLNTLKRLYLTTKSIISLNKKPENDSKKLKLRSIFANDGKCEPSFMLHNWLYSNKDIKSNLELTKSLKLIQPLLEETVQKKYTTSRMWESFQGPLTWQHFCRLAFRDSSSTGSSMSSHMGHHGQFSHQTSSGHSSAHAGSSNSNTSNNYDPEPIPALVVSSSDKDWMTISPYAVKFWDKLNLEPYSKHKNVAYLVMVPDFGTCSDTETDFGEYLCLLEKNFSF